MRLFVAVNLPGAEREAAFAATAPLREAGFPVRWTAADALHITLKFLGEVDEAKTGPIGDALGAAVRDVRPFDLALGGCGAFPDLEHPRVIWIGVERHPALELLANDVERALSAFGFTSELRPFQPHLTIGRAKKDARPRQFAGAADAAAGVAWESVIPVESVDLMQSVPGKGGSTYHVVQRAALAASR